MEMRVTSKTKAVFLAASFLTTPASADVNPVLSSMIEAALKSGDSVQISALEKVAIATWPNDEAAIRAMIAKRLRENSTLAENIHDSQEKHDATPQSLHGKLSHLLSPKLWNGQVELGGGTSSGNTDEQGVSLGFSFQRFFSEKWEHNLDADIDYAKRQGITSKRKLVGKYKLLWKPWGHFYTMNFLQVEADKFSGYKYQITESLGLGYELIHNDSLLWSVEGGPGVRRNKLDISGKNETEFLGRVSNTVEMKIAENLEASNKSSAVFTAATTTLENKSQFSARINAHLAAKLTFSLEHDTNPPAGKEKTDTISRVTLVYDF